VRGRSTKVLKLLIHLLQRGGVAVRHAESAGLGFTCGPVVAKQHDDGVGINAFKPQRIEEPADLLIAILKETGVSRHEPAIDATLLQGQSVPHSGQKSRRRPAR